jgi:hypothetical protein
MHAVEDLFERHDTRLGRVSVHGAGNIGHFDFESIETDFPRPELSGLDRQEQLLLAFPNALLEVLQPGALPLEREDCLLFPPALSGNDAPNTKYNVSRSSAQFRPPSALTW